MASSLIDTAMGKGAGGVNVESGAVMDGVGVLVAAVESSFCFPSYVRPAIDSPQFIQLTKKRTLRPYHVGALSFSPLTERLKAELADGTGSLALGRGH